MLYNGEATEYRTKNGNQDAGSSRVATGGTAADSSRAAPSRGTSDNTYYVLFRRVQPLIHEAIVTIVLERGSNEDTPPAGGCRGWGGRRVVGDVLRPGRGQSEIEGQFVGVFHEVQLEDQDARGLLTESAVPPVMEEEVDLLATAVGVLEGVDVPCQESLRS